MHTASVDLRSYADEKPQERHAFVQIVLPLAGHLEIDVSGLQDRLSPSKAVFIHHDYRHTQRAVVSNQSLIVDIDEALVSADTLDRFTGTPFFDLTPRVSKLIHYMRSVLDSGGDDAETAYLWSLVLIGSLHRELPNLISRLSILKQLVELDPFQPWTVERMAQQIEVSTSHLHALFRDHFEKTPHLWVADARMMKILRLLRHSSFSIAEIAHRAGFSDQTALTRAMKRSLGTTPAAYRRDHFS
ncbi:helix-turn-helix transcriptional regulator [Agrobacterium larrymoorei]|uniref:helix-turn-helix transcriptional regulator n=1 Tax=Agrobacterium larrymoorei TaxID=160699 RepID=UPI001572A2F7|nr:AraC family transcriptional regulator [Agrobacterium larrymoorei]NTJ42315.1 helix-turn-helix transcriptional regulator [Agrobacterium larrymoorei]